MEIGNKRRVELGFKCQNMIIMCVSSFYFHGRFKAYTFDSFILVLVVEYHYRVPQLGGM